MDGKLLASGGRVQGVALRTEADFFAQLRASPSSTTPVPTSAARRALAGMDSPDISTPEIDALLEKLARGSPSTLVDHDAPNNLPSSASKRTVTPGRSAARRSPASASRNGRPRWATAGPDEQGVWVPVERMPKPPPSFAPHSAATPGRTTPTALVGDVVTRVSESGEKVQYVTPSRGASSGPDRDPYANSQMPHPDVPAGSALYADFTDERDHPNLPYSRLPVFERLYRRIPEGQRKKFAFSPGTKAPSPGGGVGTVDDISFTPGRSGSVSKELVEKRREIESLRAELAAREESEAAGKAARRTARALDAARRGTGRDLPQSTDLHETFDDEGSGTESEDERTDAALAEQEAEHIATLAKMHGASPHKGDYSATRVSARPTDVPVVRIEDDPDGVAWELSGDQSSKPPWQERLRIAEERRAAKAAAWEEEVRDRAAVKRTNDALVAEAEATLEALRKKRADVVARQRRRKAIALARSDPKNLPTKRGPWGMAGSPGTLDNIRNMSPAKPVGTRRTFDWNSPWRAEGGGSREVRTTTPSSRLRSVSAPRPPRANTTRPVTAPSPGGSAAKILANERASPSVWVRPATSGRYASPSDAARAAAERVRQRQRAKEERERAMHQTGSRQRQRARPSAQPAPKPATAPKQSAPRVPTAPLSWVTVPLAASDPPDASGNKRPTRRELYPTPPTPPRAKPAPTPVSPSPTRGGVKQRWAEAATVEKLSDEVHVVKRLVKDQGVHLFGEVEGMKQQMGAMFEMMEKVLGKMGNLGVGVAPSKPAGSPFVSG